MDRLIAYRGYFLRHPPTHIIAAALAGYKPPARSVSANIPPPDFINLPDVED